MESDVRQERWRLVQPFVIARQTFYHADVVVVTLSEGAVAGRGEATPTSYYGESVDEVVTVATAVAARLCQGEPWEKLHDETPPGAARNAVDCAVWDLRAKQAGKRAWELAGLPQPGEVRTAMTISIGTPDAQAARARELIEIGTDKALIKLKANAQDVLARVRAVREAAPGATLILDANEAWSAAQLVALMPDLQKEGVAMIEQPLHSKDDAALASIDRLIPICADESVHVSADIDGIADRYDLVNVKLDKTGGLTEALRLAARARALGLGVMTGCMEGTSLAMAPAMLVAQSCAFVDLDGPLLIGSDREPALRYVQGMIEPPEAELWG